MATEATLIHSAAAAILSPKEGGKTFRELVKALMGRR